MKSTSFHALFSGGKDSITNAHVLSERGQLAGLVFLDTGIGLHDVLPHVKDVAQKYDWPLLVYRTPESYEALVLQYGFPSEKGSHKWFMNALKGRSIKQFGREHPDSVLASGARRYESKRRWINSKRWSLWEEVPIHSPIRDWRTEQVWNYVHDNKLPLSPAYQALRMSGDCLCGAFSRPEELPMMSSFYPEEHEYLMDLERKCQGLNVRCKWGGAGIKGTDTSLLCVDNRCETVIDAKEKK